MQQSTTAAGLINEMVTSGSTSPTAAAETSAGAMNISAMSMALDGGPECKISMLWNWYTIDACFISTQWRITSHSMMASSCIGIVLLVVALEAVRRAASEYDAYIAREFVGRRGVASRADHSDLDDHLKPSTATASAPMTVPSPVMFRPTVLQQAVRAALHVVQFGVAYFIMLLAMYFNGYIILSILVGAFVGAFIFRWRGLAVSDEVRELTGCCG